MRAHNLQHVCKSATVEPEICYCVSYITSQVNQAQDEKEPA